MKPAALIFAILLAAFYARGQTINCDSVYRIVEQMPVYKNGMEDFYDDFGKVKLTKGCQVDVASLSWVVNTEGQMIDIEVKVLDEKCASSIVTQLKTFPRWTPAKHAGRNVCIRMTLVVHVRRSR